MRKFDELTNENSCLNKAQDDEPIFVLKSTDELASSMVRTWALMYYKTKSAQEGGMTPKQREKYEEAMRLATVMDQWRANWLSGQGTPDAKLEAQLAAHAHLLPSAIPKRPLESQDVIVRLCALQAEVFQRINAESADCFCGQGGFWPRKGVNSETSTYDGTFAHGYRNDGAALGFIEQAVKEKLESMTGHAIADVGAVWSEGQLMTAAQVRAEQAGDQPSGMSDADIAEANNNPLCDRLETIHATALEMQKRLVKVSPFMKESLEKIIALSGGFMKIPSQEE